MKKRLLYTTKSFQTIQDLEHGDQVLLSFMCDWFTHWGVSQNFHRVVHGESRYYCTSHHLQGEIILYRYRYLYCRNISHSVVHCRLLYLWTQHMVFRSDNHWHPRCLGCRQIGCHDPLQVSHYVYQGRTYSKLYTLGGVGDFYRNVVDHETGRWLTSPGH